MLTLKIMFYRNNKSPVTIDSKRVWVEDGMTIVDFEQLAENFMTTFLNEYNMKSNNIMPRYILQG